MSNIQYGVVHTHTDNSVNDSVMSPEQLVKKAAELGAPAVVLTDHGTLTGVYAFMKAAKDCGIKGIPGVEAYMQEDDASDYTRAHLVLIPKDYTGYRAICKAVTRSETRYLSGRPCMNLAILQEFFGEKSEGHGHVIATSACMGGVLSKVLLMDRMLEEDLLKQQEKLTKYNSPHDAAYLKKRREMDAVSDGIVVLMKERDRLSKVANRKFGTKEKALSKLEGDAYLHAKRSLEKEKQETELAATELANVKAQIVSERQRETSLRQECRELEKTHSQWLKTQETIDGIEASIKGKSELYTEMKNTARQYETIFGKRNFYIEFQYHGIEEEKYVMPLLAKAARELNLPTVACNDVHYAENTPDAVRGRQLVQSMLFKKFCELRPGDTEYYIKDDESLANSLLEILEPFDVEVAIKGIGKIVDLCDVQFPSDSHLPKFKGGVPGETTRERLKRLASKGIPWRYPNTKDFTVEHQKRMEYELDVIEKLGYSDYLCIVQDFLDYGRSLAPDNPEKVGYSVGPGRGSAVGSLVCYLTGITGVDPLRYGLLFERFLNTDRVSMPDIDSDFDMEVRGKVIEYVKNKYGEEAVCCILAKGTLAAKAAVRGVARVIGDELYGDAMHLYDKGSRIAEQIPQTPGIRLEEVKEHLEKTFAGDADALKIIHDAMIVEGATINHSMHAAGVIISDNEDVGDYIPLMMNKDRDQWMSQCDKVEAEKDAHMMKMDFLGLRTLNIISDTLCAVYRNHGIRIEMETVPFEEKVFDNIFSSGRTVGVFQFEGDGMRNMLMQFKPKTIDELILLVALYRPGPVQYLKEILSNKQGKTVPHYLVPEMKDILSETCGKPVYQEQIMMIANKIAGFTMGEADVIRAAIAKKQLDKLAKYEDKFIGGLVASGASQAGAEKFWEEMQDFGKYAFNKSHACGYAHVAYYTAYLKEHYPTEFMCATLNYTPIEKLPMMLQECKNLGITILPPDINCSQAGFIGKDGAIRIGIGNIKSIGESAKAIFDSRTEGDFNSLADLVSRVPLKKNVAEALIESGALDTLHASRSGMLYALPTLLEDISQIRKKEASIDELSASKKSGMTDKELNSLKRRISNATDKLEQYRYRYTTTEIPEDMLDDNRHCLEREKELLGIYLSGDPLSNYPQVKTKRTKQICDVRDGDSVILCGIVEGLVIRNRSSDGAPMGFFRLTDESGDIEVCCFVQTYAVYGKLLKDGVVVAVKGKIKKEKARNADTDEDTVLKLIASEIKEIPPVRPSIVISVPHLGVWTDEIYPSLFSYYEKEGYPLAVYDRAFSTMRKTTMTVSEDVLHLTVPHAEIRTEIVP